MNLLPPINKVFALISQEERQRKVGVPLTDATNTFAFATKASLMANIPKNPVKNSDHSNSRGQFKGNNSSGGYKGQRKERPFCIHCQYHGHTIDQCYKLHGYPPGYQPRQKDSTQASNVSANTNQVSAFLSQNASAYTEKAIVGNFLQNLDANQYQRLMYMLSTHLVASAITTSNDTSAPCTSYAIGICFSASSNVSTSLNAILSCSRHEIVDFGASRHICSNANAFVSLKSLSNSIVTLPNNMHDLPHKRMISKGDKLDQMISKGDKLDQLYIIDTTDITSIGLFVLLLIFIPFIKFL
ncbi:hypothetical protein PanWU01x14_211860 [Parasponia andersonii]|uniref:Uncharacterized protein n=1 Tax=Parasponia andersonii TaxID=3476 RepID=A0A2P5BTF7_PARAD|nr:hypothetical protein PanWU01x14_211860 [Parasponia andersonii]